MKMFKNFAVSAAFAIASMTVGSASADILTFDGLNAIYGNGFGLGPNVTGDGQYLSYAEGDYVVTLMTENMANPEGFGAHIGDGTFNWGTFNWHDGYDNMPNASVVLSRADGGLFDLNAFDFSTDTGLMVPDGAGTLLQLSGSGTAKPGITGVRQVNFFGPGGANQLDNINVTSAVPEPAAWAMMILGMGVVGFAMRRRQKGVTTRVTFA